MKGTVDESTAKQLFIELEAESSRHADEVGRLQTALRATVTSPKIGDVIEIEQGYSYRGSKMVVDHISVAKWRRLDFRAHGLVLKKDGTLGLRHGEEPIE